MGDNPVAYGGFADVWEGKLGDEKVCIKVLRMYNINKNSPKGSLVVHLQMKIVLYQSTESI
jgi:hypothetical protein